MNMDQLRDYIEKVPLTIFVGIALLYGAYGAWSFHNASDSPLINEQNKIAKAKKTIAEQKKRIADAEKFYQTLDQKREEIRGLAIQLDEMKATLTEEIDIPELIRMVVTEAKKVGLNVRSIKPTDKAQKEFYEEQTFDMAFKGVYVQLYVFLERLARAKRIVRMDEFNLKRSGPATAPYVEIEGVVKLKAYRYRGSQADEAAKKLENNTKQPAAAKTSQAAKGGGK